MTRKWYIMELVRKMNLCARVEKFEIRAEGKVRQLQRVQKNISFEKHWGKKKVEKL